MMSQTTDDGRQTTENGAAVPSPASACVICPPSSVVFPLSLGNRHNHTGADRLAALADGKALLLLHGDWRDQLDIHGGVVARHDHLGASRQRALSGHVC